MSYLISALLFATVWQSQLDPIAEGRRALGRRDFDSALKYFQQAAREDPKNGEVHFFLAQLHARQGREKETVRHYRRALEILPDQAIIWHYYGRWLLTARFQKEAERVYRHLTQRYPGQSPSWIGLGEALYLDRDLVRALEAYEKGIGLGETPAKAFYLAALACRALGRLDRALEYLRQGLRLSPGNAELNHLAADLLLRRGDASASLPYWDKLASDDVRRAYGRGVALMRLDRLDEAEQQLRKALRLAPDHSQATYQLAVLCSRTQRGSEADRLFKRFRELEASDREQKKTRVTKSIVGKPGSSE